MPLPRHAIIDAVIRIKVWVLVLSTIGVAIAAAVGYLTVPRPPQDFGWFAYPLDEGIAEPVTGAFVGLNPILLLAPIMLTVLCLVVLGLGEPFPRYQLAITLAAGAAAIAAGVGASLGRGGTWIYGTGSRRYADYLTNESVKVIDIAEVGILLIGLSALLVATSLVLAIMGIKRQRSVPGQLSGAESP